MSGARSRGASNPVSRRENITTRHPSTRPKTATPRKPTESYELKENPVHSNSRRVTTTESRPTTSASTSQTQGSIQAKPKPKIPETKTKTAHPRTPRVQDSSPEKEYLERLSGRIAYCDQRIDEIKGSIEYYDGMREEEIQEGKAYTSDMDKVIKHNESRFLLIYALRIGLKRAQKEIEQPPKGPNFVTECLRTYSEAENEFDSTFKTLKDGDKTVKAAMKYRFSYLQYAREDSH